MSAVAAYPEIPHLVDGLQAVLSAARGGDAGRVTIVARRPNDGESTYPSEIITCRVGDGTPLTLVCKYGMEEAAPSFGHRGGVEYEAAVYRDVLCHLDVPTPPFHGSYADPLTGGTWLVLSFVPDSVRVGLTPDLAGLPMAAAWLGRFHAQALARVGRATALRAYTADYYRGWSRRAVDFAAGLPQSRPWLAALAARFEADVIPWLLRSVTVIHGEFYPSNLLCGPLDIVPVDWESAAVAAGEIDLASLIEGWSPESGAACEREYVRARWLGEAPPDFSRRLDAARLYLQFRWLGEDPSWTAAAPRRFDALRAGGERLGLI